MASTSKPGLLGHFKDKKFIKFLLVGGLNAAFGYGTYALFIKIGLAVPVAILVSTVLGIFFNFNTIGRLVFGSRDNKLIFKFFAVYLIVYLFNLSGVSASVAFFGDTARVKYIAGAALVIPAAVLSFVLSKLFVFNKTADSDKARKG